MKRLMNWLGLLLVCAVAAGCAHPITLAPNLEAVSNPDATRIPKTVALHVTNSQRALQLETPGGGGDKVSYFPYKDLETGLYKALSEVFANVTAVSTVADKTALQAAGVNLVVTPEITTYSFSDSIVTWPPTKFGVTLTCAVTDVNGAPLTTVKVTGDGFAPFEEFKANYSLSAVRASNDALTKLIKALKEAPELRR